MSSHLDFDWLEDKPRRGRGCGCLFGVMVFLAATGVGAGWVATASPWAPEVQARWAASPLAGWWERVQALTGTGDRLARLAPADARFYAEFSPSWWNRLWIRSGALQPGEESQESIEEARQAMREQWGVEWEEDIAPWIRPEGGVIGQDQAWSFWAASGDHGKADAFIGKVRAHLETRGAATADARHGSADYVVIRPPNDTGYALARLAGYVVMAAPPAAMPALIDQVERRGPSLATDNPRYRRVASAWQRQALGHAYMDLAGLRERPQQIAGAEALGASLSVGTDWLTIDLHTAFQLPEQATTDEERTLLPPLDMDRFDRLPSATVVALGGTATPELTAALAGPLAAGWAPLGGESSSGWIFSFLLGGIRTLEGPFALGLVASDAEAKDPVGAVLSAQPEDPVAVARELEQSLAALTSMRTPTLPPALARIAALPWVQGLVPQAIAVSVEQHRGETWKTVRAGGQDLAAWTVSEHELVIAGGGEAVKLSQSEAFEPLDRRPGFKEARGRMAGEVGAYFYADGPNVVQLLEASPFLAAEHVASARRGLQPLRAVAAMAEPRIDARGFHHAAFTLLVTP
ncbi:MAG: DUF3352 domain-containing protein [Candidatus Sericytochromatia bacterium]